MTTEPVDTTSETPRRPSVALPIPPEVVRLVRTQLGASDDVAAEQLARTIAAPIVVNVLRSAAAVIEHGEGSHRWMHADGLRRIAADLDRFDVLRGSSASTGGEA